MITLKLLIICQIHWFFRLIFFQIVLSFQIRFEFSQDFELFFITNFSFLGCFTLFSSNAQVIVVLIVILNLKVNLFGSLTIIFQSLCWIFFVLIYLLLSFLFKFIVTILLLPNPFTNFFVTLITLTLLAYFLLIYLKTELVLVFLLPLFRVIFGVFSFLH